MTTRGGRIPPDGRQASAKGVGANSKRHDLERPATPGLHGSDLQYGDRQAMEEGQRIAPAQTQEPGQTPQPQQGGQQQAGGDMGSGIQIPDPIDFLGGQQGEEFDLPNLQRQVDESRALTWLPILRQLAAGPGASSALVNAFINQARLMMQRGGQPATIVDMQAADDGIEEMLNVGVAIEDVMAGAQEVEPEIARQTTERAPDGTETSSLQLPDRELETREPSGVE